MTFSSFGKWENWSLIWRRRNNCESVYLNTPPPIKSHLTFGRLLALCLSLTNVDVTVNETKSSCLSVSRRRSFAVRKMADDVTKKLSSFIVTDNKWFETHYVDVMELCEFGWFVFRSATHGEEPSSQRGGHHWHLRHAMGQSDALSLKPSWEVQRHVRKFQQPNWPTLPIVITWSDPVTNINCESLRTRTRITVRRVVVGMKV